MVVPISAGPTFIPWPRTWAIPDEISGLGKDIFAVQAQPFTGYQLDSTIKKLSSLNLEIPCLSSGCCLKFPEKAEENYEEILQYIQLAAKLGTSYVRILADLKPYPTGEVDDSIVLDQLKRLLPAAEQHGVILLIETNGCIRRYRPASKSAESGSQ